MLVTPDFCRAPRQTQEHFLLDQVITRIIAHQGSLVLHAGLVAYKRYGIAICGPSGRGKSTLVASLQRKGYSLHGDDSIVVDTRYPPFTGHTIYPSLRVLPDTLERLLPKCRDVRAVAHYSEKLRVNLPFRLAQPLPPVHLTALLFLAPPPSDNQIKFRRMRPAEACMAAIENSFALDPTDRERARGKLTMASALADSVPAFELSYPRDYGRLDDVRQALIDAGIMPLPENWTVSPKQSVRALSEKLPVPVQRS